MKNASQHSLRAAVAAVGHLHLLYIGLVFFFVNVAERIVSLFKLRRSESSDVINIVFGAFWSFACFVNPNLFHSGPYLTQVGHYITQQYCGMLFAGLTIYWLICLVYGGRPSRFHQSEQAMDRWTILRLFGFAAATFVWSAITLIQMQPGVNPGMGPWGGAAFWSMVCAWDVAYAFSVSSLVKLSQGSETYKSSVAAVSA